MNLLLSILFATFSSTSVFSDEIMATVIFENLTDKTSISGVFYISETNQSFQINSLEEFTITLPKRGKYQFKFYSEDVNAFTSYPIRITERKNTVTIRLENKTTNAETLARTSTIKDISGFSNEQIEEGVNNGTINFIVHGLVALSPEAIKPFKDVFGVGFISENCVVDPISFRTAMNTNKKIQDYLTLKFGEVWKDKLPAQPFGL
ncbi:FEKKY domain-containing protein [Gelidibacter gilvus]|uniref:DUF4369 domain-containing protein n=1 Tax=Gelidibacter gilvus TaxID=59602 RepID=A0A4V1LNF5_9FLAO|nr:hypothetical protein [Gelidibacter gilvus]RXJ52590.1 hypothetical protein ESZ48_02535 [Gelidibacter gilvus]